MASGDRSWQRRMPELLFHPRGELNKMAKLTTRDVVRIRELCGSGIATKDVAAEFNVSRACVADVLARRRWKHV